LAEIGVKFNFMLHDFAEFEPELEPQASSDRFGGPPRRFNGIGVLDPPRPPKQPLGPVPSAPTSLLWRIAAALLLAGLATMMFFLLFARH
jgi:hypothetical protein